MKENPNIDELLNSFIDDELTAKQQAEVQQLLEHNPQVLQRLRELQKCKMLMGSLPCTEAPAHILDNIKASLARRTLLEQQLSSLDERAGTRHLLARKVLAATAMVGLIAILAVVIYTIVAPETVPKGPVVIEDHQPLELVPTVESEPSPTMVEFNGRLELQTSALIAVDAFVNRTIHDIGLSGSLSIVRQPDKSVYSVNCSREGLNLLLADLEYIWAELDSAKLFVDTDVFGRQVEVEAVSTKQIAEIVDQDSTEMCIKVAEDFAVLNNISESLPGKEVISAMSDRGRSLITIPRPVLTGNQKTIQKSTDRSKDKQTVHLTIVVATSR